MDKQQPLFNYEKWEKRVSAVRKEIAVESAKRDALEERVSKLERTYRELEGMREFIVSPPKEERAPPKEGQQDLAIPPSTTEMITAVIDGQSRQPTVSLQYRIRHKFRVDFPNNIPPKEEILALLERFQECPQVCPENFSVGPCHSKKWKGLLGVKRKKKAYTMPSRTNKFLVWTVNHCRKWNITSKKKAITRGQLYKLMERDKPVWAKKYLGNKLHGPVGSILDRVMKGKLAATPIKQEKRGRHVYVWVE